MNGINNVQKVGENSYLNKSCWLVKNLKYSPYKRCQYCDLKFNKCLFLHYQLISIVLIITTFLLFIMIEGKLPLPAIIAIFVFVIAYGYFYNLSTEKIIKSNFSLKKAKAELKELTDKLEEKVQDQTADIREKNKSLEEQADQLKKDKAELVKVDNMKDEFIMMATHELTTPITAIRGKLSMALLENSADLSDRQKQYFAPVLDATNRLNRLSQELINVIEIDQNKVAISLEPVAVDELIKETLDDLRDDANAKNNELIFTSNFNDKHINVDVRKIKTAISNIIENAINFTENGKITIGTKVDNSGKNIIISVEDTGVGIDENARKYLFGKFKQSDRFNMDNLQEQQGAGLGLYISKKYIELHHGRIWYESEKDKGTTFYFELPENLEIKNAEYAESNIPDPAQ